jgi:hypothetical protein
VPQVILQKILQGVTKTLKQDLKGNDVIGRWNETTFAILLPSTPYNAANTLIGRLREKLSEPVNINGGNESIRLEPYVGVARSKESEVIEDFVARVQKDLDENMFNVPIPPPAPVKPNPEPHDKTAGPANPPSAPQKSRSAVSRLSALFASAPPESSPISPPSLKPDEPNETAANTSQTFTPFASMKPSDPVLPNFTNQPASSTDSFPVLPNDQSFKAHSSPIRQNNVKSGLYTGDILDEDTPPSEISRGIDEDLDEMRKNWKIK